MFIYILSWAERKDIPLYQSFFYSLFLWGKIVSSVIFALTMRSATSQLIFFICMGGVSLITSFAFIRTIYQRSYIYFNSAAAAPTEARPSTARRKSWGTQRKHRS